MTCPACGGKSQYLIDWEFSGLNDSIFNYTANFFECPSCGLAYIENITDKRLAVFYTEECNYFEKNHFEILSPENIEKYQYYRKLIIDAGLSDAPITDVGCGRGGFLLYLKNNTNMNADCFGVDIDLKSIPIIKENLCDIGGNLYFKEGTAIDLPFADRTQELLTYFHVLEHIRNIDSVLQEAYRVLNATGHILIEVPDAERYADCPVGTAFWISIREHLYHFSACAISHALRRNGFDVTRVNRRILPTPEFVYPSLMILAKKDHRAKSLSISKGEGIATYIKQSKIELINQVNNVLAISRKYSSLTFWGCSAELFSLLPLLDIKHFTICDSSKLKQKSNYRGIPIEDPVVVQKTGALIIAPYLYADAIETDARILGWSRNDIFRLE
jgi:ubiquinone/menaquinone biosynthesis C-methylase UbiE